MPKFRSLFLRVDVYGKTNGRCWYCGETLSDDWQPDHQTPRCQGGSDRLDNIVPTCRRCNGSKGGRNLEEYRQALSGKHPVIAALRPMWIMAKGECSTVDAHDLGLIRAAVWSLFRSAPNVVFYGEQMTDAWQLYQRWQGPELTPEMFYAAEPKVAEDIDQTVQ